MKYWYLAHVVCYKRLEPLNYTLIHNYDLLAVNTCTGSMHMYGFLWILSIMLFDIALNLHTHIHLMEHCWNLKYNYIITLLERGHGKSYTVWQDKSLRQTGGLRNMHTAYWISPDWRTNTQWMMTTFLPALSQAILYIIIFIVLTRKYYKSVQIGQWLSSHGGCGYTTVAPTSGRLLWAICSHKEWSVIIIILATVRYSMQRYKCWACCDANYR